MPNDRRSEITKLDGSALRICGELDVIGAKELARAIRGIAGHITLEMSEVTFIDSQGLRVILTANRDRRLTITNPSAPVDRLFDITGVTDYLTIEREPSQ